MNQETLNRGLCLVGMLVGGFFTRLYYKEELYWQKNQP